MVRLKGPPQSHTDPVHMTTENLSMQMIVRLTILIVQRFVGGLYCGINSQSTVAQCLSFGIGL